MADQGDELDKRTVGAKLLEFGWRQGVIVSSERLLAVASGGSELRTFANLEPGTKLVVASQTCDIVAIPDREPIVEALLCRVEPERDLGGLVNSSRYFAVDSQAKLIAYASQRVLIPKEVLLNLQPDEWTWDEDRKRFFVQWLADRWRRADFPTALVEAFGNKLRDALRKAKRTGDDTWKTIDGHVYQFRAAWREEQPGMPLVVELRLLVKPAADLAAIRRFVEPFIDAANRAEGSPLQIERLRFSTPAEFSLADAWRFRPFDLDYLTTDGEEASSLPSGLE